MVNFELSFNNILSGGDETGARRMDSGDGSG